MSEQLLHDPLEQATITHQRQATTRRQENSSTTRPAAVTRSTPRAAAFNPQDDQHYVQQQKSSMSTSQTVLPFDPLTPLDAKDGITPQAVRRLQWELYANATRVKTSLGGSRHGHLGSLMPPEDYDTLSSIPYILPDTPPVRPKPSHPYLQSLDLYLKSVYALRLGL